MRTLGAVEAITNLGFSGMFEMGATLPVAARVMRPHLAVALAAAH